MLRTVALLALFGSNALAAPVPSHLMPKPVTVRDPGPGPTDPGVYRSYYGEFVFYDLESRIVIKCKDQKASPWDQKPTKMEYGGWVRDGSATWTFYPENGPQPKLPKPTTKESNGCCNGKEIRPLPRRAPDPSGS